MITGVGVRWVRGGTSLGLDGRVLGFEAMMEVFVGIIFITAGLRGLGCLGWAGFTIGRLGFGGRRDRVGFIAGRCGFGGGSGRRRDDSVSFITGRLGFGGSFGRRGGSGRRRDWTTGRRGFGGGSGRRGWLSFFGVGRLGFIVTGGRRGSDGVTGGRGTGLGGLAGVGIFCILIIEKEKNFVHFKLYF